MAGDNAVRSLLEKMTEHASTAYLAILERYSFLLNYLLIANETINGYLPFIKLCFI